MLNYLRFFLVIFCLSFFWDPLFSEGFVEEKISTTHHENSVPLTVKLLQEEETIRSGRPFWVAIHFKLEKDWHVYWKNPGEAGIPLKVEWDLPPGFEASPLQWPFPEKFEVSEILGFGYNEEVTLLSLVTPPKELDSQRNISLEAEVKWLVCSTLACQPGSAKVSLPLKISEEIPHLRADVFAIFEQARAKIPQTHIEVKTIRKHGIVQLEVEDIADSKENTIREAYFFPEQKNVIDPSIEPTIAQSHQKSNRYLVNLKGSDEIGVGSQSLKGVLVLRTKSGMQDNIQAIDINTPIDEEGDQDFLSLLEPSSLFIGNDSVSTQTSSKVHFEGGLTLALIFAFIGGVLLNLMPCVLPVISLKVMSFVKMAGESRSLTIKHGLLFSTGVILSFWVLASIMFLLRVYGQSVGWGFQLQEPLFVVILASVLFVFALSLFGVFEWGMFVASWAGQTQADTAQKSSGYLGSFLSGVLATAVATPCTGPFLGSAVGFAVTLPFIQSLSIFTFLGLGMCFPYLLLAIFPSLLRFMPKPGAWMETFKQLMAFVLLATVLWLLWVFSAQTDTFSLICLLVGFFLFSIGAWIYGRGCSPVMNRKTRIISYLCVVLFAFMGIQAILFPRATWYEQETLSQGKSRSKWVGWEDFSPERVAQLQREGKPFLIDFTAKWCLICQANHLVLESEQVNKQLDRLGIVKLKADWTKNDPIITQELSKFGRNSVPLYVLYGSKEDPVILPQVLTKDVVIGHLNQVVSEEIALE